MPGSYWTLPALAFGAGITDRIGYRTTHPVERVQLASYGELNASEWSDKILSSDDHDHLSVSDGNKTVRLGTGHDHYQLSSPLIDTEHAWQ